MALPANFGEWEHLQSVYIQIHNREVREEFADIDVDDDITTPRASLKIACLMKDKDTAQAMNLRERLFDRIREKASIVTTGGARNYTKRRNKPQVTLYFKEDDADIEPGFDPITGETSFRIMDAGNDDDITENEAKLLATAIKNLFMAGNGFLWRKGKDMVTYSDWDKGYQLQLLCRSKLEGIELAQRILDIQSHTLEKQFTNFITNEDPTTRYPVLPPTKPILGKQEKMPRERPIADVRFTHATLWVRGMRQAQLLVDRIGVGKPLIR